MATDRRRIQTAVLGGPDSDEPLMLPMEAIELDAFRRHYEGHTFWCGTLLGGCGGQLTTKLYTDKVCHFAHYADPDGLPHACGRHARGVNSADHLYVKSAAAAWLDASGEDAHFDYARPEGAPLGSVVDVHWSRGALRVHLDHAVPPVWDTGLEPVLAQTVPVERDILIRRWYVHRIRLDSDGTARRVRIGTEAFARDTEWFTLDDCYMTERGLTTPAVERIIRSRTATPPSRWPATKPKKQPDADTRAQVLLRQLANARKVDAVVVVTRVCNDIADLSGVSAVRRAELDDAVREAHLWLQGQADVRRELFQRLDQAVAEAHVTEARELLTRVNATQAHERTDDENRIAGAAASFIAARTRTREAAEAQREKRQTPDWVARVAADTVRRVLYDLRYRNRRHMSKATLHRHAQNLAENAAKAGKHLSASHRHEVEGWVRRSENARKGVVPAAQAHPTDQSTTPAKPDTAPSGAANKPAAHTVPVWVWKDHYGVLRAADHQTRPEATVRHVPLPRDAGPLQRLYGNLTRMITERQNASGPVHANRSTLTVRLWETPDGHLTASLTRRKGATIASLTLPAELEPLRELHAKVVAQMEARGIPRQPWTKHNKR
ncbi:zinc finger domain-containing protein [Streptomyces sp. enrichment culture]|uniref:zinc finger domain-containing protein n=1 Tax=Streptomyces sp. enrichment culture TaxID=1795815 RepID=UPI003F571362